MSEHGSESHLCVRLRLLKVLRTCLASESPPLADAGKGLT